MSRQEPRRTHRENVAKEIDRTTPRSALDSKFTPGYVDQHGRSALFLAAAGGKLEAVLGLVRAGADITAAGDNGWTPLYISARNGHADVVQVCDNPSPVWNCKLLSKY